MAQVADPDLVNSTVIVDDRKYATRLLHPPDLASMQQLFESCADYFRATTGAGPGQDEAERAFVAGPPSKEVTDKRVIGVFENRRLIGVLDSITGWPAADTWSVGVLLIDPEHRNEGLGTTVLSRFEEWASKQGARRLRTAIVGDYSRGLDFLGKAGWAEETRMDGVDLGRRKADLVFFEKRL